MSFQTTPPPPLFSLSQNDTDSHNTSPFQNLKPSILVIILILSITILVSVSLCLLLRLLNRRCLRHLSPSTASISTTSVHRVSPETPENSVLSSLPLFTYSAIKRRTSSAISTADCAVCLSKFEPNDQLRLLPLCCHAFHAPCIDAWLITNQTCPLCRSSILISESEVLKTLSEGVSRAESFRLEIGSISRRENSNNSARSRSSYSMGSFDYIIEDESEISARNVIGSGSEKETAGEAEEELAGEVGGGRSWLKDYVDRLSSRAMSFRSSGRFFGGSSRRSESTVEYDVEVGRVGEEISELFRWFSGV